MPRSLSANFIGEKDALWNRPFYSALFRFGGAVGDIYVAAQDMFLGGGTHYGIVERVGDINYVMEPRDGSFSLVKTRMDLLNNPVFGSPPKRFTDLWAGVGVRGVEVDLLQNFLRVGAGAVEQDLLHSFVLRPLEYSPESCAIELVSVSEKYLDKNEISFVLDQTDLPQIAKADAGKRANVIYGPPRKVPAHLVKTGQEWTLRADMTTASTVVPITDEAYNYYTANSISSGSVWVGSEKIAWTSLAGSAGVYSLGGLTRGSGSTPIEEHHKDDTLIETVTEWIYLLAGHELKALNQIWFKRGDKIVPVPSSSYTVELANTTLIAGKTVAIVKFTSPPVIAEKDNVTVNAAAGEQSWSQVDSDQTMDFTAAGGVASITRAATMTAQEKTKSSGNFEKSLGWAHVAGTLAAQEVLEMTDGTTTVTLKTQTGGNQIGSPVLMVHASTFWNMQITRRNTTGAALSANGTFTVSASGKRATYKTATPAPSLTTTSTSEKPLIDAVLFDADGYKDDASGTFTGVANALIEEPADVLHHLGRVPGAIPAARVDAAAFAAARAAAPASHKFAGNLIDRSSNLRELLLALGMQCRIKVDWPVDKLTCQFLSTSYSAPAKILKADNLVPDTLRVRMGDDKDLINKIDLLYGPMWYEPRSETRYQKTSRASDATSISRYGTLQDKERFWFDFIRDDNSAMADDMRDFWLARLKEPPRFVDCEAFLDQYEGLPGDIRGIDYLYGLSEKFDGLNGSQKFLVEAVGHIPGAIPSGDLRRMGLTLREVA